MTRHRKRQLAMGAKTRHDRHTMSGKDSENKQGTREQKGEGQGQQTTLQASTQGTGTRAGRQGTSLSFWAGTRQSLKQEEGLSDRKGSYGHLGWKGKTGRPELGQKADITTRLRGRLLPRGALNRQGQVRAWAGKQFLSSRKKEQHPKISSMPGVLNFLPACFSSRLLLHSTLLGSFSGNSEHLNPKPL